MSVWTIIRQITDVYEVTRFLSLPICWNPTIGWTTENMRITFNLQTPDPGIEILREKVDEWCAGETKMSEKKNVTRSQTADCQ